MPIFRQIPVISSKSSSTRRLSANIASYCFPGKSSSQKRDRRAFDARRPAPGLRADPRRIYGTLL